MNIVNIAAYHFVAMPDYAEWREPVKARCTGLGLKGTVLLSPEGINLFLAGTAEGVDAFVAWLRSDPLFGARLATLEVKRSRSAQQPFNRMLVKLKREIITMRHPMIRPEAGRAPAVDATTLRSWLDQGHDDAGRPLVLLDTRNAFEVELGTFENARELDIGHFSEFPDAVKAIADELRNKTVVSFCTGGIRCEKAALFMEEAGIENVLQLDGGILKYFELEGGAHWQGECFVFDHRVALDPELRETATKQCFACRAVVTPMQQRDPRYVPGKSCPACASRTTVDKTANSATATTET